MMSVFADSHYFLALVNVRDQWHARAKAVPKALRSSVVTTRTVLLEFADALRSQTNRALAAEFIRWLEGAPNVEILPLDDDLWGRGLERYENRPDKAWSLTDCISFVVMEDRGIRDALTGDKHFEQAGFNVLLKRGD